MKETFIQKLKSLPLTHKATANALSYSFSMAIAAIIIFILWLSNIEISIKYIPLIMLATIALEFVILSQWIKIAEKDNNT